MSDLNYLDEAGLCHWLIDRMPYFAVPRFIEFRDSLPRNAASRIMKYRLREDGVTATTWDLDRSSIVVPRS